MTNEYLNPSEDLKEACMYTKGTHPSHTPPHCLTPPKFLPFEFAREKCEKVDADKVAAQIDDADFLKDSFANLDTFLLILKGVVYSRGAASVVVGAGINFISQSNKADHILRKGNSMRDIPIISPSRGSFFRFRDESLHGSHVVVCVGWEEKMGRTVLLLQNSWGAGFGDDGFYRIFADEAFFGSDQLYLSTHKMSVNRKRFQRSMHPEASDVKNTISATEPQFEGFLIDPYELKLVFSDGRSHVARLLMTVSTDSPFNILNAQVDSTDPSISTRPGGVIELSAKQDSFLTRIEDPESPHAPFFGPDRRSTRILKSFTYVNSVGHKLRTTKILPYLTENDLHDITFSVSDYVSFFTASHNREGLLDVSKNLFNQHQTRLNYNYNVFCNENIYNKDLIPSQPMLFQEFKVANKNLCDQLTHIIEENNAAIMRRLDQKTKNDLFSISTFTYSEYIRNEKKRIFTSPSQSLPDLSTRLLKIQIHNQRVLVANIDGRNQLFLRLVCFYVRTDVFINTKEVFQSHCRHLRPLNLNLVDNFSHLPNGDFENVFLHEGLQGFDDIRKTFVQPSSIFFDNEVPIIASEMPPPTVARRENYVEVHTTMPLIVPRNIDFSDILSGFPLSEAHQMLDFKDLCKVYGVINIDLRMLCNFFKHPIDNVSTSIKHSVVLNPLVYVLSDQSLGFTFKCIRNDNLEISETCKMSLSDDFQNKIYTLPFNKESEDAENEAWGHIDQQFRQQNVVTGRSGSVRSIRFRIEREEDSSRLDEAVVSLPRISETFEREIASFFIRKAGVRHFDLRSFCKPKQHTGVWALRNELQVQHPLISETFLLECFELKKSTPSSMHISFEPDGSQIDVQLRSGWKDFERKWMDKELTFIHHQPLRFESVVLLGNLDVKSSANAKMAYFQPECATASNASLQEARCTITKCEVRFYNSKTRKTTTNDRVKCISTKDSKFAVHLLVPLVEVLRKHDVALIAFLLSYSHPTSNKRFSVFKYEYDPHLIFAQINTPDFTQHMSFSSYYFTNQMKMRKVCAKEYQNLRHSVASAFCDAHNFKSDNDSEFPTSYPVVPGNVSAMRELQWTYNQGRNIIVLEVFDDVKSSDNTSVVIGIPFKFTNGNFVLVSALVDQEGTNSEDKNSPVAVLSARGVSLLHQIPLNQLSLVSAVQLAYQLGPEQEEGLKDYVFLSVRKNSAAFVELLLSFSLRFVPDSTVKHTVTFQVDSPLAPITHKVEEDLQSLFDSHSLQGLPYKHPKINKIALVQPGSLSCDVNSLEEMNLFSNLFLRSYVCGLHLKRIN
eukprot:GDKJ01051561.1.p1 GENE.GDKJ01051561.1~~GDKJ01051561.1.p1  ORF type:complete len:1500 (+),score=317.00 GDKJ01051561.1:632-4501(+)